tara:strand:- start:1161 stop:2375 length:1215 start_codon:yes stop_codon:yes gene_type:complete
MGTVFVSKSGDDGNPGTDSGSPKLTIQSAVDAVDGTSAPRIVTILDSGTYNELVYINAGGGFGVDITIQGDAGQLPILDGNGLSDVGGISNGPTSVGPTVPSITTLKNIKFIRFSSGNGALRGDRSLSNGGAFQVSDCEFDNNDKVAQDLASTSAKINTFNRCKFTRNTIFIGNSYDIYAELTNCVFGGVEDESCIDFGSGRTNSKVQNCSVVVNMDDSSIAIRAGVIENCAVQNLTATSTGGGNTTKGISAGASRSNNLTFGNFNTQQEGGSDGGSNITGQDPLFTDTTITAPDLQFNDASPLRNTGKTIADITADFNGIARPQEGAYDIGAFEFVYWMDNDANQSSANKFGPNSFEIRATKNKLATRKFPVQFAIRQAPFALAPPGPSTLRARHIPYKVEKE